MFIELTAGAFLLGDFIYHRLVDEEEAPEEPELPRTEEGIPMPMIFGRCRVRAPILAWHQVPTYTGGRALMDMYFVLGLGFQHGRVVNRIYNIWAGSTKATSGPAHTLSGLTGDGNFEDFASLQIARNGTTKANGVEFLNGRPDQVLVDDDGDPQTFTGQNMLSELTPRIPPLAPATLTANQIPAYRGLLSVALIHTTEAGFDHGIGEQIPAYQFEVSSTYEETGAQPLGIRGTVGQDANPITVIYEVLTATLGKLGLSTSLIDMTSFEAAKSTLWSESHGYSRCFTERTPAADIINDVLRQIDGVLYQDHASGTLKIKLIRPDYDPATIPHITKANCVKLTGFAFGSRTNLINKVSVKFLNRDKDYTDDAAMAHNLANAVGQSGQVVEETIEYRGCCDPENAKRLAERELAARSRPVLKCRALVMRSLLRVNPGDAVRLTWGAPDIAGAIMRVAGVNRGTLEDGAIALDLISDVNYVWRNRTPLPPDFGSVGLGGLSVGLG